MNKVNIVMSGASHYFLSYGPSIHAATSHFGLDMQSEIDQALA